MKYAIIIPDGCADEPQQSLGGRSPLEAARLPNMDAIASAGVVARADNTPRTLPAGSDVANLSLLGYNPLEFFTGRAPLEASAQGIELHEGDWAIRCNLVTVEQQTMRDFTAGHISSDEAAQLLAAAQEHLADRAAPARLEFVPGVSYRNLLIYRGGGSEAPFSVDTRTTPPHDLTDQSVLHGHPRGPGSDLLNRLMSETVPLFADHPVNMQRRQQGKLPATCAWLWGLGCKPALPSFAERHGLRGAMITAVDLLRGLAALVGWRRIDVPGATGYIDTDYAAKGRAAIEALADASIDIVCVHVEAPDEASHQGDAQAKIAALEQIDRHIVGPVHEALRSAGEYRILVSPDHPTLLRTKTHTHGVVPAAMCGSGIAAAGCTTYDERAAAAGQLEMVEGWRLMSWFLGAQRQ